MGVGVGYHRQPLPVRRREFLKSIKKHYAKLMLVLQVCAFGGCGSYLELLSW